MGLWVVRLCICRCEEGGCRFRKLDYSVMLQEGFLLVVLHVLAKDASGRAAVAVTLVIYFLR